MFDRCTAGTRRNDVALVCALISCVSGNIDVAATGSRACNAHVYYRHIYIYILYREEFYPEFG